MGKNSTTVAKLIEVLGQGSKDPKTDSRIVQILVKTSDGTLLAQGVDVAETLESFPTDMPSFVSVVGVVEHPMIPMDAAKLFASLHREDRKHILAYLHCFREKAAPNARESVLKFIRALEEDHEALKAPGDDEGALSADGTARHPVIKRATSSPPPPLPS